MNTEKEINNVIDVNSQGEMEHREGEVCIFIPPPFLEPADDYRVPQYPGPEPEQVTDLGSGMTPEATEE